MFGAIAMGIVITITIKWSHKDSSINQAGGPANPTAGTFVENLRPASVSSPLTSSARYEVKRGPWRRDGDELIQDGASETNPVLCFGDPNWTDYDISQPL